MQTLKKLTNRTFTLKANPTFIFLFFLFFPIFTVGKTEEISIKLHKKYQKELKKELMLVSQFSPRIKKEETDFT